MRTTTLLALVFSATVVIGAKADEKPIGVPPSFATVGRLDLKAESLVLHIVTVKFVPVEPIRQPGEKLPAVPNEGVRSVYETRSRVIWLKTAEFADARGKKIEREDLDKRLKA